MCVLIDNLQHKNTSTPTHTHTRAHTQAVLLKKHCFDLLSKLFSRSCSLPKMCSVRKSFKSNLNVAAGIVDGNGNGNVDGVINAKRIPAAEA